MKILTFIVPILIVSSIRVIVYNHNVPHSGFYLQGPNSCEFCEVLTSSQILILKQLFSFSFCTVNELLKPHNTRTCITTAVPLHLALRV